jgi:Cyclic nucleotide-binding domain
MNLSALFQIFGATMEASHFWDLVGNAAPLIAFCAYLVKDIIWLRMLTIVSAATWLIYIFSGAHVTWLAAFWNAAFILVNVGRIGIEMRERLSIKLTPEERDVYATTFPSLTPVEFAKLVAIGKWMTLGKDTPITEQGKRVENVMLVYRGKAAVHVNGNLARYVDPPEFIGEVSFLTRDTASATVSASESMRVLAWPHYELQKFLNKHLAVRVAFRSIMSADLAKKLKERG